MVSCSLALGCEASTGVLSKPVPGELTQLCGRFLPLTDEVDREVPVLQSLEAENLRPKAGEAVTFRGRISDASGVERLSLLFTYPSGEVGRLPATVTPAGEWSLVVLINDCTLQGPIQLTGVEATDLLGQWVVYTVDDTGAFAGRAVGERAVPPVTLEPWVVEPQLEGSSTPSIERFTATVENGGVRLAVRVRGAEACPDFGVAMSAGSSTRCTISGGPIYDNVELNRDGTAELHLPLSACHSDGWWEARAALVGYGFSPPIEHANASFTWRGAGDLAEPRISALKLSPRSVAEGTVVDAVMTVEPSCDDLPVYGYFSLEGVETEPASVAYAELRREGDQLLGCALVPNAVPPGEYSVYNFGAGARGGCGVAYYGAGGNYQQLFSPDAGPAPAVVGSRLVHPIGWSSAPPR